MKKSKKQKCTFDLLPFHVIEAASTGDTEAIQAVLKHWGSIIVLMRRKCQRLRLMYAGIHIVPIWRKLE